MGKQKARALFNPSILCFFDREEECRPTKPYTIDLYFPTFFLFESVYISKYFVFLYPWDAKTGVFGHQDADFVFLFPIIV